MRTGRAIVLAIAGLLLLPGAAFARSANIVDADVHLRLAPDASLLVREDLTFDYQGTFEGSYRDILLKHGESITDIRVAEDGRPLQPGGSTVLGSHYAPGLFGATSIADGARIVWHYQATNEKHTWTIRYRVIDGAVAYNDVIDVFWGVWGDQWDFGLPHLRAELPNPQLNPKNPDYRVWGHPRGVQGKTRRDPGVARLVATNVPDHTGVEMRITVPRTPGQNVSGARQGEGDGLPKILAKEKGLDEDYNSTWNKLRRWVAHNAFLLSLLIAALAFAVVGVLRFLAREHPVSTPEYLPEPPDDASPALAYGLAHEGEDSSNTALATLLDLLERGYYDSKPATSAGETMDIAIAKAHDRPSEEKLEAHEKATLDFFDELLGGNRIALGDMSDLIPEHDETWRKRWQDMTTALNDADEGQLEWDRNLNPASLFVALGAAIAFAAIVLITNSVDRGWPWLETVVGAVAVFGILGIPSPKLKRLSPKYRERSSQWAAFEHWTQDFPRLKDDPPATLELWKKILVYGVAFGTAERMIKSGRIPEPVVASSEGTWSNYWFTGAIVSSSFDGSSFSSGFASQVAPESSSSGGGGGFSGGGGGSSGGGGGGSW